MRSASSRPMNNAQDTHESEKWNGRCPIKGTFPRNIQFVRSCCRLATTDDKCNIPTKPKHFPANKSGNDFVVNAKLECRGALRPPARAHRSPLLVVCVVGRACVRVACVYRNDQCFGISTVQSSGCDVCGALRALTTNGSVTPVKGPARCFWEVKRPNRCPSRGVSPRARAMGYIHHRANEWNLAPHLDSIPVPRCSFFGGFEPLRNVQLLRNLSKESKSGIM